MCLCDYFSPFDVQYRSENIQIDLSQYWERREEERRQSRNFNFKLFVENNFGPYMNLNSKLVLFELTLMPPLLH